ncbi:MAG: hypothetical protein ABIK86_05810 [candidate division WOR-3 bacterium]
MKREMTGTLTTFLVTFGLTQAAEVKVFSSTERVSVSVVRRVDVSYYLLTGNAPLEFEVEGPAWLRVYTRLWWPGSGTDRARYRLSLWQDDVQRPVEHEVSVSPSSYGPNRRNVGQWRSFFVQVPAGTNRYRLVLDEAGSDTVGVRFVFQEPRPWRAARLGTRPLELVEGRDSATFYEVTARHPVKVTVEGPCRIRLRVRLNYTPELLGEQSFGLVVSEGKDALVRRTFRVSRSPSAIYGNEPGLTPSGERRVGFSLGPGAHELSLVVSGTLARTAALAVDVLAGEKYE